MRLADRIALGLAVVFLLVSTAAPAGAQARPAITADAAFKRALMLIRAASRPGLSEKTKDRHLRAAIDLLRSMLTQRPDLVRVRLELARAFFLKGEDTLARRHFERVLAGKPPAPVVAERPSVSCPDPRAQALDRAVRRCPGARQ